MKKHLSASLFLIALAFLTSCKGPKSPEKSSITLEIPSVQSLDSDPYFIASTTQSSPYAPTSITRNILQDKNGIIWLATWEGIISYDGTLFTNHTNKEQLRRYHVFDILEDRKGDLWFATIGAGVYHYDGKTFTNYSTIDGLVGNSLTNMYEDRSGKIWFGTDQGMSLYDGVHFTNYTTEQGMPNHDTNDIIEDDAGNYWIGARGVACIFDGKHFDTIRNATAKHFTNVRTLIKDKTGKIWLGGNDGLWHYKNEQWTQLSTDFTGYLYEDRKGHIWASASTHGNAHEWTLSRRSPEGVEEIIKTHMLFGITEDKDGNIWFGSVNGVGRYDGTAFEYFQEE